MYEIIYQTTIYFIWIHLAIYYKPDACNYCISLVTNVARILTHKRRIIMSLLSNLKNQNTGKDYFKPKELKTLWADEYMRQQETDNVDHSKNMVEIRAQQSIAVEEKTIKAKNISTVAGIAVASAIILKEYGGVVASKALPMVSKFL